MSRTGCSNHSRVVGSVIVSFTRSLENLKIAVPHILKRHPRRSRWKIRCHALVVGIRVSAHADAVRGIVRAVVSGAAEREGRLVRNLRIREREVEGLVLVCHRHYHAHHDCDDDDEQERTATEDYAFSPPAPSRFVWSLWQRSFEGCEVVVCELLTVLRSVLIQRMIISRRRWHAICFARVVVVLVQFVV